MAKSAALVAALALAPATGLVAPAAPALIDAVRALPGRYTKKLRMVRDNLWFLDPADDR